VNRVNELALLSGVKKQLYPAESTKYTVNKLRLSVSSRGLDGKRSHGLWVSSVCHVYSCLN
jgi:hypothetical protein